MSLPIDAKFVRLVGATQGNALAFGANGEITDSGTTPGGGGGGSSTFLALTDVNETTYSGKDGYLVQVVGSELKFVSGSVAGAMLAATYDPNTVAADCFDMDNMVEGTFTKILSAAERTKLANVAENAIAASGVTYGNLNANGDVGTGAGQVATGNHNHTGTYIGTAGVTFEALDGNLDVGTGAAQVAAGNHLHEGVYQPAGTYAQIADITFANLSTNGSVGSAANQVAPGLHAAAHLSGGADVIKLDDLGAPDDNTDLNVTVSAHGLAPKLSGNANEYLDGTGAYSIPAGGAANPAGADTQIQFNDGGSFGGDGGLTYNKTTDTVTVVGALSTNTINERTAAVGVTVDGVLLRDGEVDGIDVAALNTTVTGITDGIRIDAANFTINFIDQSASFVEAGLTGVYVTQGTSSFPNRQGDAVNTVQGTDYDGTHVAGALWKSADSGYVAGSADYAGILGGYDCINNQIGGWISGSNHSVLMYDVDGHSYISGGGYNLVEAGRCIILGSTACAITGNADGSTIIGGTECLIEGSTDAVLGGRDCKTEASASRSFGFGNNLTVQTNHQNAVIFGQDAKTPGADSVTHGGDMLNVGDDVRVFRKTVRRITTDATVADPFYNMTAFEAGKVYAGYVKVKVIALHDDGVNGDAGNVFNHAAFEAETSFMWDEDSNHGNFDGGSNASAPNFSLTPIGTDKIGVGGVTLNLSTGVLRIRVTGKAATTINWVAEIEVVSTAAAS